MTIFKYVVIRKYLLSDSDDFQYFYPICATEPKKSKYWVARQCSAEGFFFF